MAGTTMSSDRSSVSDEELLQALEGQDLEALEELYDRHSRTAMAIAYRVLGDQKLSEDVVQEAFLAVWRQSNSFRPNRGSARAWLYSIVRHRAIDMTRGRTFVNERMSLDEIGFEPQQPDVWYQVSANLDNLRVKQAVDTLPEEQREAITLAYYGGQTQREIAERTGVPLGTVKGRMRLGLQKLRSMLIDSESGESD
jgi:RNA polymerase sigma-70 factor (ECF subfamily)